MHALRCATVNAIAHRGDPEMSGGFEPGKRCELLVVTQYASLNIGVAGVLALHATMPLPQC